MKIVLFILAAIFAAIGFSMIGNEIDHNRMPWDSKTNTVIILIFIFAATVFTLAGFGAF